MPTPTSARGALALLLLAALILPAADGTAQLQPGDLPPLDASLRAAIVDSITAAIDSIYVLKEPAEQIVATLRTQLAQGAYDELTDPIAFAEKLHEDAQTVHHDGHFRITAIPPLDPQARAAGQEEDPAEAERFERSMRARNHGFQKAEILPGGVGYLRFNQFAHGEEAFAAATAAMNFLSNCSAVILDVRGNGGGSAAMIRYLCGYLFEERTHLINWDIRAEKMTTQSYSADFVPGRRLLAQPVYVLTSAGTFSAAEEFTFDLQNRGRAIVVGETTGGGGHTVSANVFDFGGFRILARLPYGRAYDPISGEGWEGVGVKPDLEVPVDQALDAAYEDALGKLIAAEKDPVFQQNLQWGLQDVKARRHPVVLTAKAMKEFVGSYGPRRVFIEDGLLRYQREDGPVYALAPVGGDLFRVGDLDYFRLGFVRDGSGKIVRAVGYYDNGEKDDHDRDE